MGRGWLDGSNPSQLPCFLFFRNSLLLNGVNPNLGSMAYSGKLSELSEEKCLTRWKKYSFKDSSSQSNILSFFWGCFIKKDETRKGQLFMRKLNHAI